MTEQRPQIRIGDIVDTYAGSGWLARTWQWEDGMIAYCVTLVTPRAVFNRPGEFCSWIWLTGLELQAENGDIFVPEYPEQIRRRTLPA